MISPRVAISSKQEPLLGIGPLPQFGSPQSQPQGDTTPDPVRDYFLKHSPEHVGPSERFAFTDDELRGWVKHFGIPFETLRNNYRRGQEEMVERGIKIYGVRAVPKDCVLFMSHSPSPQLKPRLGKDTYWTKAIPRTDFGVRIWDSGMTETGRIFFMDFWNSEGSLDLPTGWSLWSAPDHPRTDFLKQIVSLEIPSGIPRHQIKNGAEQFTIPQGTNVILRDADGVVRLDFRVDVGINSEFKCYGPDHST